MISYQTGENQYAKISSGGVVYKSENGSHLFAVLERKPSNVMNKNVLNQSDKSTFHLPKGTLESGETLEQNAEREIREEAGCDVELQAYLGTVVHSLRRETFPPARNRDGNEITINYFVAKYIEDTDEGMDHEHDAVLWLSSDEAIAKLEGYWKHENEFIRRAVQWLQTHESAK